MQPWSSEAQGACAPGSFNDFLPEQLVAEVVAFEVPVADDFK
jgi:hypothetical protein